MSQPMGNVVKTSGHDALKGSTAEMLKAYLADNGPTATERLVLSSHASDEATGRATSERLRQTEMQVSQWAKLCNANTSQTKRSG
ncbi:hypothetical protein DL764_001059 [Monosporascus ibericus]|uniref:Uncharacterized protein n=1 Tax=Monosporascus ibericus TaxID=155417 RepID=A0A4Q4TR15_9PEZI|nr:hypothetical protein DL764_001059 [Monosporascus ibericus]